MSAIDMPAAVSISLSASTKGRLSRAASRRPTVDLPTPISPTSTIGWPVQTGAGAGLCNMRRGLYSALASRAKGSSGARVPLLQGDDLYRSLHDHLIVVIVFLAR